MASNGTDTGGIADLYAEAKSMTASPLLYIGAVTVVLGLEIAELLPLSDTLTALSLFPIALALLYGQLTLLALLRRRGYAGGCR
ncbi:hypothetical protein ACFQMA_12780 [Halosimplex aquaticum]|uniref:Uncharacterized protein n=1 Tax=Halosimplex aquaticum TaxID=3026162 RepID=A0ABD5Y4L1_9EURY|nr:hypothetical protein [Halosimplex aquaticum]